MGFRKPTRSAPVKIDEAYRIRRERQRASQRLQSNRSTVKLAAIGLVSGVAMGAGYLALPDGTIGEAGAAINSIAVEVGLARARAPQPGDEWPGCGAARAAGTAPIYAGEPGYRPGMDGDGDGVACEPVPY